MVSDPDKKTDNADASKPEALSAAAGFSSAAEDSPNPEDSVAETDERKSWARQFAAHCESLWENMKERLQKKSYTSYAMGTSAEGTFPYEKTWFRTSLGHQVFDCGNCIHMSGTKNDPVSKKQIERMVKGAISRKDPPWETIYMFDCKKDEPDLRMAGFVQGVINEMRAKGKIPPTCPISCCTDATQYPRSGKDFDRMLRDLFANKAQPDSASEQPGFHAHQRPGFHAV